MDFHDTVADGEGTGARQYVVYYDLPEYPGQYVLKVYAGGSSVGRFITADASLDALHDVIPDSHGLSTAKGVVPIVEVWINKRYL